MILNIAGRVIIGTGRRSPDHLLLVTKFQKHLSSLLLIGQNVFASQREAGNSNDSSLILDLVR